jgi:hypothetical protein
MLNFWKKQSKVPGWELRGNLRAIHRDGYEIKIQGGFREGISAIYTEGGKFTVLDGETVGKNWNQMNLAVPKTADEASISHIVPRVAEGLQSMGREFLIYKLGEPIPISMEEQQAAMEELHGMGMDAEVSPDKKRIDLKKRAGSRPASAGDSKAAALRMMKSAQALRGQRYPVIVLAKSGAAIDSWT